MSSPLGLISRPNFKKDKSTTQYNRFSKKSEPETNINYEQSMYGNVISKNADSIAYFPTSSDKEDGRFEKQIAEVNKSPHTNDIYDVRTQSIIDWSKGSLTNVQLKEADFAYLRFLGVYPNNRLIVCRKFGAPVGNDLSAATAPVSTIVTWREPGADFFDISFGEEWVAAEGGFKKVLNDIGEQFRLQGTGDGAAGGMGITPLPGFTEIWQRQIMKSIGLIDEKGASTIPSGNPNIIKEAMMRKTTADDEVGSGLNCSISVKVVAEYEQKFIGGVDPTKAFYDIIGNIVKFGTQDSLFYLNGGGAAGAKATEFITKMKNNPGQAIIDLIKGAVEALQAVASTLLDALGLGKKPDADEEPKEPDGSTILTGFINSLLSVVSGIVKKFEVRIFGIINALTGQPSGTYHVTIGNPKRPLFCSGDMIVKEVNIKFGETLAFNDLPSRITAEFTMTNTRPLGLQEIMARFAQGQGRSYKAGPSSWQETAGGDFTPPPPVSNTATEPAVGSTQSSDNTPVGGPADAGSTSDGTKNTGGTQSNETFAHGEGQESTTGKKVDPDVVKNPSNISEPPATVANDVKADPTIPVQQQGTSTSNTGGTPDSGKTGESKPITDGQIPKASDEQLSTRQGQIDNELKNTPETVKINTNKLGTASVPNEKSIELKTEKKKISTEQEARNVESINPTVPSPPPGPEREITEVTVTDPAYAAYLAKSNPKNKTAEETAADELAAMKAYNRTAYN
jgi:hypothetical protein